MCASVRVGAGRFSGGVVVGGRGRRQRRGWACAMWSANMLNMYVTAAAYICHSSCSPSMAYSSIRDKVASSINCSNDSNVTSISSSGSDRT